MFYSPQISVIVPTYNRASSLNYTLIALSNQNIDFRKFEVIIVDDGSTDNTKEVVEKFQKNNYFPTISYYKHSKNRNRSSACNTGILNARSNLITFVDDDIRPMPDWISAHLSRHETENRQAVVVGLVLYPIEWEKKSNWVRNANDNYRKSIRYLRTNSGQLPPVRFSGGNSSMVRNLIIDAGLFDENMNRGQDGEMGFRLHNLGIPILFEEKAVVYHYSPVIQSIDKTLASFRRYYRYDRKNIINKYPNSLNQFGHWFLEPFDSRYDNYYRWIIKKLVRMVSIKMLQDLAIFFLQKTDRFPLLYNRLLCQFVLACEAISAMRESEEFKKE